MVINKKTLGVLTFLVHLVDD